MTLLLDASARPKTPNAATTREDLEEWAIVYDGPRAFLGRLAREEAGVIELDPAYDFLVQTQMDPRSGSVRCEWVVLPLSFFPSLTRVRVERPSAVVLLRQMGNGDRDTILARLTAAESLRSQLLAAQAGIVVPPVRPLNGARR